MGNEPETLEIRGESDVLWEARPQTTEHGCSFLCASIMPLVEC